jgi:hypothetical protein
MIDAVILDTNTGEVVFRGMDYFECRQQLREYVFNNASLVLSASGPFNYNIIDLNTGKEFNSDGSLKD